MAATNINRVVLTGNLTRDPELRSTGERHGRLLAARRVQHAPQGRVGRVGGQAQLLRRHGLGRPGRELRALPGQGPPGRDRRPPRVARVAGRRRATSARPSRSSPTPCSSSAGATTGGGGGGNGFTAAVRRAGRHARLRARRRAVRWRQPPAAGDDDIPF